MATTNENADSVIGQLADSIKLYHNIGLDSEGRSHHYDPAANEIVVCTSDRRGLGVRGDDDIQERITPPEASTGVWDYIQFVEDEVEGVEWVETDAPEEKR